jgi:uncharacterized membrane protein
MNQRRDFWLVVILTLLAFLLRLLDLDGRSLWLDESFTLLRLYSSWEDIFSNIVIRQDIIHTVDVNPPLYFALLKAWAELTGQSILVLRFFSAIFTVLVVPASYVLGYRLMARREIGLISAGLTLLNPSYQWYTSELRNYSLLLFLSITTSYIFLIYLKESRLLYIVLWTSFTFITIFTHYSAISLLLTQSIVLVLIISLKKYKIKIKEFTYVLIAICILLFVLMLFAPLWTPTQERMLQLARAVLTTPAGQGVSLISWLAEIVSAFTFGFNASDPTGPNGIVTILISILVIIGLNINLHNRERIFLYTFIFIPILFWFGLSFFIENKPSFRYVIFVFPFLSICQANALSSLKAMLWRWPAVGWVLRTISAILVFGSAAFGTAMTFVRTPTWQDDWRAFTNHIRQHWRSGDVLVINLYTPEQVLDTYLRDLPIDVAPIQQWLRVPPEEMRRIISAHYQRIWYANTGGDRGLHNLEAQALFSPYLLRSRIPFPARTNIIELLEYEVQPFVSERLLAQAIAIPDGQVSQTHIAGYEIAVGNPYHPHPNFWLSLYWRRGGEAEDLLRHTVALRLYDAQTNWWEWSISADLLPSPADWEQGKIYRTRRLIPLPLGLPLQPYQMELRLLTGLKGEAAQVARVDIDERSTRCCLRITQWPVQHKGDRHQLTDTALFAEYPHVRRPNQPLPVVLTWYPARSNLPAWQTRLKVEGLLGGVVASLERMAGGAAFPVTTWPVGEPTRDPYTLMLPPALQPGIYRLSLERWRENRKVDGVLLGLLHVEDYPYVPVADQIQYRANGRVGELALLGYSVNGQPTRGKVNDVITHWRVAERPARDGVIFLHMLDAQGKLISQDDNPPIVDGLVRSTTTYRQGEGINQLHRLEIPADLPPGQYQLYAGVYDRQGMVRWPAQQDDRPAKDDLIFLGTITIE